MSDVDPNLLETAKLLASRVGETLGLEHKNWLDLGTDDGQANLIRSFLGLKNNDGGWLIIGVDNGTGKRSTGPHPPPLDVRTAYDVDLIAKLLVGHTSYPIDFTACYPEIDGGVVAAFHISPGLQTPIISTKGLKDTKLVKDAIYCRSSHNGQVSTHQANHQELKKILDVCMRNREASIGEFVRRHWSDMAMEISHLQSAKEREIEAGMVEAGKYFDLVLRENNLSNLPKPGFLSVGVAWDAELPDPLPTKRLFNHMMLSHPHASGWPPWMNPEQFQDPGGSRPVKLWEARDSWYGLIALVTEFPSGNAFEHLDFMQWSPKGFLFYQTPYFDDLPMWVVSRGTTPSWADGELPPWMHKLLTRGVLMEQVAESMFTAQRFVTTMFEYQNCNLPQNLFFKFQFSSLRGRQLLTQSDVAFPSLSKACTTEEKAIYRKIKIDAGRDVISEATWNVLRNLFVEFHGEDLRQADVDRTLNKELWKISQ